MTNKQCWGIWMCFMAVQVIGIYFIVEVNKTELGQMFVVIVSWLLLVCGGILLTHRREGCGK